MMVSYPLQWLKWHPKGNVFIAGANDSTIWMYQRKFILYSE